MEYNIFKLNSKNITIILWLRVIYRDFRSLFRRQSTCTSTCIHRWRNEGWLHVRTNNIVIFCNDAVDWGCCHMFFSRFFLETFSSLLCNLSHSLRWQSGCLRIARIPFTIGVPENKTVEIFFVPLSLTSVHADDDCYRSFHAKSSWSSDRATKNKEQKIRATASQRIHINLLLKYTILLLSSNLLTPIIITIIIVTIS